MIGAKQMSHQYIKRVTKINPLIIGLSVLRVLYAKLWSPSSRIALFLILFLTIYLVRNNMDFLKEEIL